MKMKHFQKALLEACAFLLFLVSLDTIYVGIIGHSVSLLRPELVFDIMNVVISMITQKKGNEAYGQYH